MVWFSRRSLRARPLLLEIEGDEKVNPVEKMKEALGKLELA